MRFAIALLLAAAFAATAPIKLFLKDGTYQLVRSYERAGDRVKFYSIERDNWEEIPADLVDFKATEENAKQAKEDGAAKAREVDAQTKADAAQDEFEGHEVAPGVHLGEDYGFYAVVAKKVTLMPVSRASTVEDKRRKVANVLLPAPVLKNRRTVTLDGAKSAVRFPKQPDHLFVVTDSKASRFMLVRVKVKGDHREVEAILQGLGQRPEHNGDEIEMTEVIVAPTTIRLVPKTLLIAGEYALVEIIDDKLNLYVADFGIGT